MLNPVFPFMILIHLDPLFKWYFDYDFDFTKNEPNYFEEVWIVKAYTADFS